MKQQIYDVLHHIRTYIQIISWLRLMERREREEAVITNSACIYLHT